MHNPIQIEVFKHRFSAIAEEMGVTLRKASLSPNIKERCDFSCAIFDKSGNMISQAAHIPVHLGSMQASVIAAIKAFSISENKKNGLNRRYALTHGDVIVLNDPFKGGTHLPDITMVSPIFIESSIDQNIKKERQRRVDIGGSILVGFVASRAHHADVGGMSPGSMPIAHEIYQEGLIIPPIKLVETGEINPGIMALILANVRTPGERSGDLRAQIAANNLGVTRMIELVSEHGYEEVYQYAHELIIYTEHMTRKLIRSIPEGEYSFTDYLDDDGMGNEDIPITVRMEIKDGSVLADFSGSAKQQKGGVNAVYAITLSAVYYVFRCLIGMDVPNNCGYMIPIKVIAPPGSIVNAVHPASVAGGNVETSQRIVDVLLGALSQACPQKIPAASQGTMNNLTIGGYDKRKGTPFVYYETIGGGTGASAHRDGLSATHSHMTNTLNTPIESLEFEYPMRVLRYEVRHNSGGRGLFNGGNGLRRDVQILTDANVTLLTERRNRGPYGLAGGGRGKPGKNKILRREGESNLPSKTTLEIMSGEIISIHTPGGGGYGEPEDY